MNSVKRKERRRLPQKEKYWVYEVSGECAYVDTLEEAIAYFRQVGGGKSYLGHDLNAENVVLYEENV